MPMQRTIVFSKGMNTKDVEFSSPQPFEIVTNIDNISVVVKYIMLMIYNKVMIFLLVFLAYDIV